MVCLKIPLEPMGSIPWQHEVLCHGQTRRPDARFLGSGHTDAGTIQLDKCTYMNSYIYIYHIILSLSLSIYMYVIHKYIVIYVIYTHMVDNWIFQRCWSADSQLKKTVRIIPAGKSPSTKYCLVVSVRHRESIGNEYLFQLWKYINKQNMTKTRPYKQENWKIQYYSTKRIGCVQR